MRVSAKSDYALRALVELAADGGDRAVSAEELGRRQSIPHGFLQAILSDLRRAGLVGSRRGQSGGYLLARDPAEVTVADVMRATDGPLVSVYDVRPEAVEYDGRAEILQYVWIAARASLRDVLDRVTIADLAAGGLPPDVAARTDAEDAWSPR